MRRVDPIGKLVSAAFLALAAASVVMALSPKVGARRTAVEQKDAVVPVAGVDSWAIGAERYPVLCRVNPTWDTLTIPKGSPVVVRDERDRAWAARVDSLLELQAQVLQRHTLLLGVLVPPESVQWRGELVTFRREKVPNGFIKLDAPRTLNGSVVWYGTPDSAWAEFIDRDSVQVGLRADGVAVWRRRP